MTAALKHADSRPRIHLWPAGGTWQYSFRPTGARFSSPTAGTALDEAMASLDARVRGGVVVIVEPPT